MKNWSEYRFGELVKFPPKLSLRKGGLYPFIEMENLDPNCRYVRSTTKRPYASSGASKFQTGDVLMARITPCLENGKIAQFHGQSGETGFGSTEFFVFRASEKMARGFLYYLAKSDLIWKNAVNSMVGASGRQRADAKFLKKVIVTVPDVVTQEKIAAVATAYDDLIETNKRRIALLEKMAEELYREWFVRMRFPGHQNIKFVKGVPEGWDIARVDSLGKVVTGKTPSTAISRYYYGQYPFIKTPDMHGNMFISETDETLSDDGIRSQPSQTIPENSLCVSCIGTGGIVSIATKTSQTNQQINSVCLKRPEDLEWGYFVLRSLKETIRFFGSTGTTMTNLSKGKFSGIKFFSPPIELRDKFHMIMEPVFSEIQTLASANSNLTQTRDLLLPRLISGKLSVEDLDIQFPPSMQEDATEPEPAHA